MHIDRRYFQQITSSVTIVYRYADMTRTVTDIRHTI